MDFILILAYFSAIIISVHIFSGFKNTVKTIIFRSSEQKLFKNYKKEPITDFYIIIPALREQKVIKRTLDRINKIDYPKSKINIVVALDKKEKPINGIKTKDVIEEYIKTKNNNLNIFYTEYAGNEQKRSYQLNSALNFIKNKVKNKKNTFIGVYDADSYPDLNVLKYIDFKARQDKNNIAFQQMINYLLNFNKINKLKKFLLLSNAYYQTMWNYCFEQEQYFKTNKRIDKKHSTLIFPYCMGHGEFFRLDMLSKIGGFPNNGPADGIQIGYILTAKNIKINPIPFDDYCESPEKLSVLYKQHTFWFCGNMYFFKTIKDYKLISLKLAQIVNKLFIGFKWLFRPYIIILTIIALLIYNSYAAYYLITIVFGYYLICYNLIKIYSINKSQIKSQRLHFWGLELPLSDLFLSFGGFNGAIKLFNHFIFNKILKFKKVERL
jgi:cellulose synthase/poly-beta-1,6-N-acetylglucosamine synthase-like glycosyltransferase